MRFALHKIIATAIKAKAVGECPEGKRSQTTENAQDTEPKRVQQSKEEMK